MLKFINNFVLSTQSHRVRSKASEMFKISTYVSLFVVSSIFFSDSSLAKTVCSTEVVKEEGTPTLSAEMLDAMFDAISTNTFILDEPYTVINKKKFCADEGDSKIGSANSFETFSSVPNPSPTPREGDIQSVSQTRADGTRTWTYTYIDGVWVLTGYKYNPAITDAEP